MENNEIKDIEKNVDEVVEETITEEAINEEVIEEANEIIEAVEEEKDVKKVKAALEALKAKLANAGSAVKVKVAGAGSAIKGKGKIAVTTISGKMVNAKDAVKNSKFGKAVGNGTTKVVVYVKGHKKGVIAIASGAVLVAALGIGGCAAHKHFSNKPAVETTATPTPSVAPTATPVPTQAPTVTPVPTQAPTATPVPQSIVETNVVADNVVAQLEASANRLFERYLAKNEEYNGLNPYALDMSSEEIRKSIYFICSEHIGEDYEELNISSEESMDLFARLTGAVITNNILIDMDMDNQIDLADLFVDEKDKAVAAKFMELKKEMVELRLAGYALNKKAVNDYMAKVLSFYTKDLSADNVSRQVLAVLEEMGWQDLNISFLNYPEVQIMLTDKNKLMYNLVNEMCVSGNRHNVIFEEKANTKTLR